jgi:transglutaminase-like putative cysteine protease
MPYHSKLRICPSGFLLLFAVVALSPIPCRAQGFPPLSPDDLNMTSEPKAPGAPAIILFREVDRDDGRTSHEDNYLRIKILTEEGREHANVEIIFDKGNENVTGIRARTIKPDGASVDFDGKVYEKTIEKARGLKYLAKTFTLPDVQVGSIIEYRFTYDFREEFVFSSHWILSDELFTRKAKFSLKPFARQYDPPRLRWTWKGLPPDLKPVSGPDKIIRLEVENIPAFQDEDFMPPPNELKARVDFIYDFEFLDSSTADQFWKEVAKKRRGTLDSFIGKRKAMEDAVAQIVSPGDAPEVKLRKIYDRVQQIRNTSYELRKTEQEEKRDKEKPVENVEELWKRGYGDGNQLTWLYLALVRAAGFEAYGVWASSRNEYFFSPVTMENRKLNANVVLVRLNGKDLYFDPGAEFTPYGMLTWSETGVTGLCLDKEGGSWVTTTLPDPSESRIQHAGKLRLTDAGTLEGKLTVTYSGLEAMYQRLDVRHADDVARKKFLEDRIKHQIPATADVELTNQPDWSNSETPLVAEYRVKIPDWASNAGKREVIPAGIFTAVEKHLFEHANRVQPIYVEYPYEKDDDLTIELPQGWQVSNVPPPQDQPGRVLAYSLQVGKDGNALHLTRKLSWNFLVLDPKYYPALRNFFQSVRTADDQQIVLQPAAVSAGD